MKIITATDTSPIDSFKIVIIRSLFNESVTSALEEGAVAQLQARGIHRDDITVIRVPGAVEIPFIAKKVALTGNVDVIIALGAVIRGETSHYDYVCRMVSQGCLNISIEQNVPIIFGVLTTENDEQAMARVGGIHGHKGKDAADGAVAMREILQQIDGYMR